MKKKSFALSTLLLTSFILISCNNNSNNSSFDDTSINISIDIDELDNIAFYNCGTNANLKIELNNIDSIHLLKIDNYSISKDNYTLSNNTLIVRYSVMQLFTYGNHLVNINNNCFYKLMIWDSRTPTLTSSSRVDYLIYINPSYTFELYGGYIDSIHHNDEDVTSYTIIKDNRLEIKATLIEKLGEGEQEYTVTIKQGGKDEEITTYINIYTYSPKSTGDTVIKGPND